MKKNFPKIIIIMFLAVFIVQMIGLIVLSVLPLISQAADEPIKFNSLIAIPGLATSTEVAPTTLGQYIVAIYKYAIGIVGILAAIVLMYGGVVWITAFGSGDRISEAQSWIKAALTGLVLALSSFMILNMVNPDLVSFKALNILPIEPTTSTDSNVGYCYHNKVCIKKTKTECESLSGSTWLGDSTTDCNKMGDAKCTTARSSCQFAANQQGYCDDALECQMCIGSGQLCRGYYRLGLFHPYNYPCCNGKCKSSAGVHTCE